MVMVIALITSLYLFRGLTDFLITELEAKVDLSVYLQKDVSEREILRAKEELSKLPEVKEVEYISEEEALERFKEYHKDNPLILEILAEIGENPLPASLNIKVFEAPQYENLVSYLKGSSFQNLIEKIDYYEKKPVIERLYTMTSGLNRGGIVFSLILAFLAVLVAFNTIRLAIYNSREEIVVQRLVGASNWFIRGPYIFQGIISGFFATLVCLFIFTVLCFALSPKVAILTLGFNLFGFYIHNLFLIFLIQLATGMALGVVSSIIAIRKYLQI
jgi:cell division transport system permease protein